MKYLMLFSILIITFFTSCKDKCNEAGTGGSITIVAFPMHHSTPIISSDTYPDSVFVKFNTQDFPGTTASSYNMVLEGEAGEDHIHIENLKCGDYFIYMTGFDITINQRVTGGIPYHVDENAPSEIDLNIPVTE
ncbi:MAG: hypothetical protein LH473_10925 [Chitinophagales bacterium]|nr:hypothetical protein [Chitinophagales bacterium]